MRSRTTTSCSFAGASMYIHSTYCNILRNAILTYIP